MNTVYNNIRSHSKLSGRQGLTLMEIMATVAILVVSIVGSLQAFIYVSSLSETNKNTMIALTKAQSKMEEIHDHTYSAITTDYASGGTPGNKFSLTKSNDGLDGMGVIYIDSSNASLLTIEIVVCWRNKETRIIGEDKDLDGVLDAGEDTDGNGKISSKVTLISYLAQR